jgi:hypothetical protein
MRGWPTRFRNVFIFDTADALSEFVNSGWEFGANAMAAVRSGTQGGGAAGGVLVGHLQSRARCVPELAGLRGSLARSA